MRRSRCSAWAGCKKKYYKQAKMCRDWEDCSFSEDMHGLRSASGRGRRERKPAFPPAAGSQARRKGKEDGLDRNQDIAVGEGEGGRGEV